MFFSKLLQYDSVCRMYSAQSVHLLACTYLFVDIEVYIFSITAIVPIVQTREPTCLENTS